MAIDEHRFRKILNDALEPLLERLDQQSAQIELLKQRLETQQQPIQVTSIRNAAQQLGWSESKLRQEINAGEFKSGDEVMRNGDTGSYMIDVQAYLRRKRRDQKKKRIC